MSLAKGDFLVLGLCVLEIKLNNPQNVKSTERGGNAKQRQIDQSKIVLS